MVDPAVALVVFGIASAFILALFWPRLGLAARVIKVLRLTDRVLMEDSLKHLYNCQYLSRRGTIESISGALEIRRSRTVKLVAALESRRLVHSDEQGPQLTAEGEAYAIDCGSATSPIAPTWPRWNGMTGRRNGSTR